LSGKQVVLLINNLIYSMTQKFRTVQLGQHGGEGGGSVVELIYCSASGPEVGNSGQ
jgi:hypothetical protein